MQFKEFVSHDLNWIDEISVLANARLILHREEDCDARAEISAKPGNDPPIVTRNRAICQTISSLGS